VALDGQLSSHGAQTLAGPTIMALLRECA
jgi:hypothetical protein